MFILSFLLSLAFLAKGIAADSQPSEQVNTTSKTVQFTPPNGWHYADEKQLPNSVKVMLIGKGAKEYPPTLNLATESYQGTLKQYLQKIKKINASRGREWKELGSIETLAGKASLSQVIMSTSWGSVKMMHVILAKEGEIYILSAAALLEEFPKFYQDFFSSMRSLRFES